MLNQKLGVDCQKGGILLVALMILLLVEVLGVTIVEIGLMEYKSGHYAGEEHLVQQAADAGVEWGMERIYLELQQPANLWGENLPEIMTCGNSEMYLAGTEEKCGASIGQVILKSSSAGEPGSCVYEFTSTGSYWGAQKTLTVHVIYYFSGGYQSQDLNGQIFFVPRQYLNRGQLTQYTQ